MMGNPIKNRVRHNRNPNEQEQYALWEDAGALGAERESGVQSHPTDRPAPRMISREWLGLPNPNLMHNHPRVAIKNWALLWADGGHRWRQNRRLNDRIQSLALPEIGLTKHGPTTGSNVNLDPVTDI